MCKKPIISTFLAILCTKMHLRGVIYVSQVRHINQIPIKNY